MKLFFEFIFSLVFTSALAQEVHTYAPTSPTSPSSTINLDDRASGEATRSSPSMHLIDYGGLGGTQTLTTRNSQGNDFAVSLEGIRLNSPAQGDFDFGSLSNFGLGSAELIRGGYSPFSTSPSGELQLRLPDDQQTETKLTVGSYQTFGISQRLPTASFSWDQSENNYSYEAGGVRAERIYNQSKQANLRVWKRTSKTQAWAQLLYVDQETPGSTRYPTLGATYQNINPTAAFQTQLEHIHTSSWINFQKQSSDLPSYQSASENKWITLGTRLQSPIMLTRFIRFEPNLEYTVDKLWHDEESSSPNNFNTPTRNTWSLSLALFGNPHEAILIHPHIRFEYLSDVSEEIMKIEGFSIHPGLGIKWMLSSDFSIRSNLAMISRAPNFNEMYFSSPPFALANRNLKRQHSMQGDIGFDFTTRQFKLSQTFYIDRTRRIIKTSLRNGVYQPLNQGTGVGAGLENEVSFTPHKSFEVRANYTVQYTSLNDRVQPLKPTHRAHGSLAFFSNEDVSFDLPVYYRSTVKENDLNGSALGPQLDLGAHLRATYRQWKFDLRIWNLLGWHRIEKLGYPLSAEPYAKISAAYDF